MIALRCKKKCSYKRRVWSSEGAFITYAPFWEQRIDISLGLAVSPSAQPLLTLCAVREKLEKYDVSGANCSLFTTSGSERGWRKTTETDCCHARKRKKNSMFHVNNISYPGVTWNISCYEKKFLYHKYIKISFYSTKKHLVMTNLSHYNLIHYLVWK